MIELPRALSSNPADPRYDHLPLAGLNIEVWVDGVHQRDVETYDMDEGYVVRLARDASGAVLFNDAGDELIMERVYGVVTVARRPRV